MGTVNESGDVVARTLHRYVLSPVSEALEVCKREKTEVDAEREAYVQFSNRVAGIETVSTASPGGATLYETTSSAHASPGEQVRNAFRQTVMSVSHYEALYGETLEEHAAQELSVDVAAGLQRRSATPFTEWYKTALLATVEEAVEQREKMSGVLATELESLDASYAELAEIVESAGQGTGPHSRDEVRERLETLASRRQRAVHHREPLCRASGHNLCAYLYQDHQWTYPALTAVARCRTALV